MFPNRILRFTEAGTLTPSAYQKRTVRIRPNETWQAPEIVLLLGTA